MCNTDIVLFAMQIAAPEEGHKGLTLRSVNSVRGFALIIYDLGIHSSALLQQIPRFHSEFDIIATFIASCRHILKLREAF